ncbi:MAG: hypothetical protein ACRD0X_04910 [Thermoanaerobaculia bacterium]
MRVPAALATVMILAAPGPAPAAEGEWSVEVQPVYMQVYGHDPHVLTVHEVDLDATPALDSKAAVLLESDTDFAYRAEILWARSEWSWGLDFLIFRTPQAAGPLSAAADGPGGAVDEVAFEVADRTFTSSGPGDVLFYRVLEDTTIETWTLDLYALKTLAEGPGTALQLQLGLRNADFDNDYRAVVGIEDVGGARLDASSNYDRMMGPLVGLAGSVERGKHSFAGYLGQSLVFGNVELSGSSREFSGPFSETPAFFAQETLRTEQEVGIPITDFRLDWRMRLTDLVSVGAGLDTAAWWEVPVPPGIVPGVDGDEALAENTIVFFGVLAAFQLTF